MSSDLIALTTALMLGCLHALEVDHMVAVTTFVSRRPTTAAALRFGLHWGLGHSAAVLAAGGVLLLTGLRLPSRLDAWGECLVGLMLAALGAWALASARKLHLHSAEEHGGHTHLHLHGQGGPHHHDHGPSSPADQPHEHGAVTLVGLLHGLAGTSGVVALVPVTMMDRVALGVGYLTCFGVGVTAGMALFAMIAATAVRRSTRGSLLWGRRAVQLVGLLGIAVGAWWIVRAAAAL